MSSAPFKITFRFIAPPTKLAAPVICHTSSVMDTYSHLTDHMAMDLRLD
jgi:hypothetical protein